MSYYSIKFEDTVWRENLYLMAKIKLGSFDIQKLLNNYESDLRQLQFQVEHIKQTIRDLKAALPAIQEVEANEVSIITEVENVADILESPAPAKKQRKGKAGRPAGTKTKKATKTTAPVAVSDETPTATKAKVSKKKAEKKVDRSGGYKLSEYDLLVFQALEENGRAMITSDLQTAIEGIKASKGETADPEEILKMIIRSLQKLANRREDIKKVAFEGRGQAYALPAWVNNKGIIKPAHKRK